MDVAKQLLELVAGYAVRWRTRGGFVRILFVAIVASASATHEVTSSSAAAAYAALGTGMVWLVAWAIGSGRVPMPRSGTTVVFAIDVEVEAERNFRRIFTTLQSELGALELEQPIRLRRIAAELVTSNRAAERYARDFAVDQIIWGRALAGKLHNEQIQSFSVNYYHRIKEGVRINIDGVMNAVQTLAEGREWRIRDVEELLDVGIVAEDFLELSLGIVGIMLFVEGRIADSAVMFARVVVGLEQHAGLNPTPERQRQIERFRAVLADVRTKVARDAHDRGDHEKAIVLLRSVREAAPQDQNAVTLLARCYYYLGDIDRAIAHTEELRRLDKGSPVVLLNLAFFSILQRKYERAGQWYDRFLKSKREEVPVVVPSVSEFLEERYDEHPEEHAYLYGLAVVNGVADRALMREELSRFITLISNNPVYEPLRARASKLLAGIAG